MCGGAKLQICESETAVVKFIDELPSAGLRGFVSPVYSFSGCFCFVPGHILQATADCILRCSLGIPFREMRTKQQTRTPLLRHVRNTATVVGIIDKCAGLKTL